MIEAKGICFHYKNCPVVLQNVDFQAEDGHFLAILGNNGAGKSTLLKCMNGILKPDAGSLLLDGEDLLTMPHRQVAQRVAFVAQTVASTQMTVHDMVMLGRRPYMGWSFSREDHDIVHAAMARLGLMDMRGRFLNQLSGGERQKVMLARALAQQPRLLLLDEPTSALDIRNQYQVLKIVGELCRTEGLTAVVVIHDLTLALRFCDRFLLMRDGQVYRCGGLEVLDKTALREVYGVDAEPVVVNGRHIVLVNE
ncbi:MAG TPA: ABC transporter ATP-binding protein [Candidatus Fournierella excrementavium]|uniref:ABC transporter ATP-binding protein n=1 Tax=Candidatus Allofournierella excrementavium TaxID=2838591 RepID=UPI001F84BF61|nr:ABC transporter ATP-binding protein [Candidatus Fournierella excrementavium]